VRRISDEEAPDGPWTFCTLEPWSGYVAALFARGRGLLLSFREWGPEGSW